LTSPCRPFGDLRRGSSRHTGLPTLGTVPDTKIEQRLREAGAVFIEAHDRATLAIREAANSGMPAEAISHTSGLSHETVAAFLRASAD
jgi:hypothetical protein